MADTKDALGRTVSRRGFLSMAALAGAAVAGERLVARRLWRGQQWWAPGRRWRR